MGSIAQEYDFIIVGGMYLSSIFSVFPSPILNSTQKYNILTPNTAGPSGSVLASTLSRSLKKPSVLLLEAGGSNTDATYLVPADRYALAFSQPDLNWGYKTAPQTHLKGQQVDYSRGKGLGGSTAINFSCWVVGADEDFEEWARKVGDEDWGWERVKKRLKKIESLQ